MITKGQLVRSEYAFGILLKNGITKGRAIRMALPFLLIKMQYVPEYQ